MRIKVSIIGAGSPYTSELIGKLSEERETVPVREICLMDTDEKRLTIMHNFCRRFAKKLNYNVNITSTTDLKKALDSADFVNTQIRVGGNRLRVKDERIPMSYGLIGQETTGAGGFAKGLRTIPAMLTIAHEMEKLCPNAWIINYANPTGMVTEAVIKYSTIKIAGLCAGGLNARRIAGWAMPENKETVRFDLAGLNHLSFAYNITIGGRKITEDEFNTLAEGTGLPLTMCQTLQSIPISYLQYYFQTRERFEEMKKAPKTRGETVLEMEEELYAAFADPTCDTRPALLDKRGGGGYADVAVTAMKAIYTDLDNWTVANIPNRGTLPFLSYDAVIETPCIVNATGFLPVLPSAPPPKGVWGLISAVKNYEQLTVEAAVNGCRDTVLMALMAHPLVRDYNVAVKLLPELLEAGKEYLQPFYV